MKKVLSHLAEIKLVGITTRTNNTHLFESDPSTNKVAATVQKYFHEGLSARILNKKIQEQPIVFILNMKVILLEIILILSGRK